MDAMEFAEKWVDNYVGTETKVLEGKYVDFKGMLLVSTRAWTPFTFM
jgi:hypothetical protein